MVSVFSMFFVKIQNKSRLLSARSPKMAFHLLVEKRFHLLNFYSYLIFIFFSCILLYKMLEILLGIVGQLKIRKHHGVHQESLKKMLLILDRIVAGEGVIVGRKVLPLQQLVVVVPIVGGNHPKKAPTRTMLPTGVLLEPQQGKKLVGTGINLNQVPGLKLQ